MGTTIARVVIGVAGALLMAGGILLAVTVGAPAFAGTLALVVGGAVLLIAAIVETTRYRSEHAERTRLDPGPGGGESTPLEARFRPTAELFVDPTSNVRMRVYMDSTTGERRYVAE